MPFRAVRIEGNCKTTTTIAEIMAEDLPYSRNTCDRGCGNTDERSCRYCGITFCAPCQRQGLRYLFDCMCGRRLVAAPAAPNLHLREFLPGRMKSARIGSAAAVGVDRAAVGALPGKNKPDPASQHAAAAAGDDVAAVGALEEKEDTDDDSSTGQKAKKTPRQCNPSLNAAATEAAVEKEIAEARAAKARAEEAAAVLAKSWNAYFADATAAAETRARSEELDAYIAEYTATVVATATAASK